MPRRPRIEAGGFCYHLTNRGIARRTIFSCSADYRAFIGLMSEACAAMPMRVLAFCLMPNHYHIVVRPHDDGELSRWIQWIQAVYASRRNRRRDRDGHLWKGRYYSSLIQEDAHLLTVVRYVERNPLRANLVDRAEQWPWSSIGLEHRNQPTSFMVDLPVERPRDWTSWINEPQTQAEVAAVRDATKRSRPYGSEEWSEQTLGRFGGLLNRRRRGRPRKGV